MAQKIRKGDRVQVLTGRDKGRQGEVIRVMPTEDRALVQGINLVKRHQKPTGIGNPGGINEKESPIHLSNLALLDPKSGKPTRVGFKMLEDGKKVRVARASGEVLDA
ncbi:MAG: 50S ribosomal protein L24 [Roseomonas sp.]|jgi:large subunit ribosomal protein L24|nr:50S ribosomal protein L24 [Roseomonas sp.]MCA3430966.1 50S ribosomal protein L24 [Roseomonas sp.]MCA3435486.1 50S ribosomal protein L24 [Roseomonas sp.]MCE2920153.1 50S ribosomal protein L24 [Roseomonas sp.]